MCVRERAGWVRSFGPETGEDEVASSCPGFCAYILAFQPVYITL